MAAFCIGIDAPDIPVLPPMLNILCRMRWVSAGTTA